MRKGSALHLLGTGLMQNGAMSYLFGAGFSEKGATRGCLCLAILDETKACYEKDCLMSNWVIGK